MRLWIEPPALKELKQLSGASRAKIRRAINALAKNPRPAKSIELTPPPGLVLPDIEPRRLSLGKWRVLYVIDEPWDTIGVLAIRKRPPYDYDDLAELLSG
jgi:mRNA interferase RelE/StbE